VSDTETVDNAAAAVPDSDPEATTATVTETTGAVEESVIFDFTNIENNDVSKFDRIDDAIMGGISTSQLRQITTQIKPTSTSPLPDAFASWSGVCRTDGGGFCGTRTLPFQDGKPLQVVKSKADASDSDSTGGSNGSYGFYIKLKLMSDNEPERRVWKMTTRTKNIQTSEQVYQSSFEIPKQEEQSADDSGTDSDSDTDRFIHYHCSCNCHYYTNMSLQLMPLYLL